MQYTIWWSSLSTYRQVSESAPWCFNKKCLLNTIFLILRFLRGTFCYIVFISKEISA